jgi:hypothetical protein
MDANREVRIVPKSLNTLPPEKLLNVGEPTGFRIDSSGKVVSVAQSGGRGVGERGPGYRAGITTGGTEKLK